MLQSVKGDSVEKAGTCELSAAHPWSRRGMGVPARQDLVGISWASLDN